MSRQRVPSNYMKRPFKLIDDFSSGTWTVVTPSNTTIVKDTTKTLEGISSLKITVNAPAGTLCSVDRDINVSFVGASKQIMLKVWCEDPSLVEKMIVYFGNSATSWTKEFHFTLPTQVNIGSQFKKGWNFFSIIPSEGTYNGGFNWNETILKLRLVVVPKTNAPASLIVDSLWYDGVGIPKILITFDDGWKTVYDNAYPVMKERGIRGTIYAIPWYHKNQYEGHPLYPWFCKPEQLKEIYNDGWCIGNHTWNHDYYFKAGWNPIDYAGQIKMAKDWLTENGFGDGGDYLCFPNGEFDHAAIDAAKELVGIKTARPGKTRGAQPHDIDTFYETNSRNFSYGVTLDQGKKWVDYALENGGTSFFMFHQIPIDDTSRIGMENPDISWSAEKFRLLMDYIVERNAVEYCVTNDEWYRGMVHPRFTRKIINRQSI
ncbi:polysaccharide deacetylase family protein [Bacillus thuringiensis]|uniref:polysaccharide deacetylase family protein n=1 Tax=Bacillus thuringiensis TaxID=1428 RepID=UPI00333A8986